MSHSATYHYPIAYTLRSLNGHDTTMLYLPYIPLHTSFPTLSAVTFVISMIVIIYHMIATGPTTCEGHNSVFTVVH